MKIIKDIKISMSNGHDGISSELLKLVNDDISSCITLIINQSLTQWCSGAGTHGNGVPT